MTTVLYKMFLFLSPVYYITNEDFYVQFTTGKKLLHAAIVTATNSSRIPSL